MRAKQYRSCKFCNMPGLVWGKFPNRFGNTTTWLVEPNGNRHQCDEYRRAMGKVSPVVNPVTGKPVEPVVVDVEPVIEPTIIPEPTIEPKPVVIPKAEYPEIPNSHHNTPKLAFFLKQGVNVMLVGPAGSGKSYASGQVADFLGLPFYPMPIGPQTSKSDVLGFNGPHGYVTSPAREAYEKGGVLLLDEKDSGDAGALTILNGILANSRVSFPDKVVNRHPDFIVIAGCNTYGLGGNAQYNGRRKLDAATLDRYVGIDWDYDRALEESIFSGKIVKLSYQEPTHVTRPDLDWLHLIWLLRDIGNELDLEVIFGSRKIYSGKKLLDAGVSRAVVEASVLWFGVSADDKAKILARIGR